MRKSLTILGIVLIILFVFAEFVVPNIAAATLTTRIKEAVKTDDVQLNLASAPNFLITLGRIDDVTALARDAKLGEIYVSELTLDGKNVSLAMPDLIADGRIAVKSADKLELKGIVSEENLRELISRKIDRLENVHVSIDKEQVLITAEIKIFGKMAEAELAGIVLEDNGSLYFRMTRLNMKNALLGKLNLDNLFGDILLVGAERLPPDTKFDDVSMQDGHVTVTASFKKTNG